MYRSPILRTLTAGLLPLIGVLAALILATAIFTGCGGGDDDAEPTGTADAATSTSAGGESTSVPESESVDIGASFWHAGWKVTLAEATLDPGDGGLGSSPSVSIEATFENLGEATAAFGSQLVLTAGAETYSEETFEQDLPQVPGGLSGKGLIAFSVEEDFAFDDATLTIGNVANNQAVVPIGPDGDDLVTLEPVTIDVTGSAVAGGVTLTVESAELRADIPDTYDEVEKGHLALTIRFSATVAGGIPIGQGVLQSQNVALKLPDGTAVAVMDGAGASINELLQGKEGTTISDLSVRFEVDDPAEGDYAFVVRGNYAAGSDPVEGELVFTISAASGGSTPAASRTPAASGSAPAAAPAE